jgi:hypothetical protein
MKCSELNKNLRAGSNFKLDFYSASLQIQFPITIRLYQFFVV